MEEESTERITQNCDSPPTEAVNNGVVPDKVVKEAIENNVPTDLVSANKDESGIELDVFEDCKASAEEFKESFVECEGNEDARSVGDLDSLPAGDELVLGAAGSDSGVEGCGGRALSSGGGSRSCASSVVSCGSGCGSESSSLAGAPPRPRRVHLSAAPPARRPAVPAAPRPATAPRGPNLATRERARSREKPIPPEKPRPLTPKPRIRPTADLPNLVRESPALRAKPTKTSTARCRTPNSPCEEKRWPVNGPRLSAAADAGATRVAADKYGTLPRRRRDADADGSPKHDTTPPTSRRPTVTRSVSSRSSIKTRVRIYAEKTSQTVLVGTDIESALAGIVPNIENRVEVSRSHRGVQASCRDSELSRLAAAAAGAEAAAAAERARREHAEAQLAEERTARLAAIAQLERNSSRLLELAGAAGAGAGADGCLRALEDQLKSAGALAAAQRADIDHLRERCNQLHVEASTSREAALSAEARLAEAEREAAEMQEFLAAETGALAASLRDAEAEVARLAHDLERRRAECRQLVRMCEQRRQEALLAGARARGGSLRRAVDVLAARVAALARREPISRSDSGDALSGSERPAPDDDRSRLSDDNSAELLDSETEPYFLTDPDCAEEWWSGPEGAGAWSGDELSPEREGTEHEKELSSVSVSERESLRKLSAAIASRRAEPDGAGAIAAALRDIDARLAALAIHMHRDKVELSDKNVADVVVKKLAELDASKNTMDQYKQSIETLKNQLEQTGEESDLEILEEEAPAAARPAPLPAARPPAAVATTAI